MQLTKIKMTKDEIEIEIEIAERVIEICSKFKGERRKRVLREFLKNQYQND